MDFSPTHIIKLDATGAFPSEVEDTTTLFVVGYSNDDNNNKNNNNNNKTKVYSLNIFGQIFLFFSFNEIVGERLTSLLFHFLLASILTSFHIEQRRLTFNYLIRSFLDTAIITPSFVPNTISEISRNPRY